MIHIEPEDLYHYAERELPNELERLRWLDRTLAELHRAGIELQRSRLALFLDIMKHRDLKHSASIACLAFAAFIAFCTPAITGEGQERSWHLLTQSEGGTVSLIKDLSQHECEFARARALHQPATEDEKQAKREADERQHEAAVATGRDPSQGYVTYVTSPSHVSPGDIRTAECFQ